ncbi:MAG: branched-chain amino acid dehydrogenase [Eubacteriales Family XIII. Incertae Sedis bacterium]|nr:MAG: branched-chain amino acid dehydrogenase [Clostridiales Family XIII bacterium]
MNKVVDIRTAIDKIKSGDKVAVGGFGNVGGPMNLLYELEKHPEINHLTTISEDFQMSETPYNQGFTGLLLNGQIDEIVVSFFGHKKAQAKVDAGEVKLTLIPQGTLAERLRAAGAGLGGFYTPTGVGTVVEEGKETKVINGKKYLLELPLKANVALVKAYKADRMGNAVFAYTAQNFNTAMATAADIVILECEKLVENGEIVPDQVQLPGVFVDYVVHCEEVHY